METQIMVRYQWSNLGPEKLSVQIFSRQHECRWPSVRAVVRNIGLGALSYEVLDFRRRENVPGFDCGLARDHMKQVVDQVPPVRLSFRLGKLSGKRS